MTWPVRAPGKLWPPQSVSMSFWNSFRVEEQVSAYLLFVMIIVICDDVCVYFKITCLFCKVNTIDTVVHDYVCLMYLFFPPPLIPLSLSLCPNRGVWICEQHAFLPVDPRAAVHQQAGSGAPVRPPALALSPLASGPSHRWGVAKHWPWHLFYQQLTQVPPLRSSHFLSCSPLPSAQLFLSNSTWMLRPHNLWTATIWEYLFKKMQLFALESKAGCLGKNL